MAVRGRACTRGAAVGAERRRRSAVPGSAQGGRSAGDPDTRRRVRARRRALCPGRIRRDRTAVLPVVARATVSSRLPRTSARTDTAGRSRTVPGSSSRWSRRCARRSARTARSGCGSRARTCSTVACVSTRRWRWPLWSRRTAGSTTSTRPSEWPPRRCIMIEASMAVPRGYALFVPNAIRQRVGPPGGRCRPIHGSAPGRPGSGRGALRPDRGSARPDRRPGLCGEGTRRRRGRDPNVPGVQSGMRRAHGAGPVARVRREPARGPGIGPVARTASFAAGEWSWSAADRPG